MYLISFHDIRESHQDFFYLISYFLSDAQSDKVSAVYDFVMLLLERTQYIRQYHVQSEYPRVIIFPISINRRGREKTLETLIRTTT